MQSLSGRVQRRRDALEHDTHEFSGGQRQRIAIARALAVSPRLIVCDGLVSALDVSVQTQTPNLLLEQQREHGISYLFITHNIGVVEDIAHDVVVMRESRIEESGPARRLLRIPKADNARTPLAAMPQLATQAR